MISVYTHKSIYLAHMKSTAFPGPLLATPKMTLEHFVHIPLKMHPNLLINLESKDKNFTYDLG